MGRGRVLHTAGIAAAVVALLAVVAAASRSGAVAFGGASDQVRGTVEVAWPFVLVAIGAAFVTALFSGERLWRRLPRERSKPALRAETVLVIVIVTAVFSLGAMIFIAAHNGRHLHRLLHKQDAAATAQRHKRRRAPAKPQNRFVLPEWAVPSLVGVGVIGGAAAVALRRRRRPLSPEEAREELASDLDAALADLREEGDVRAAIVALYRRMLTGFALLGIRRGESEAPREYLARALAALHVPEEPATRLTALFEEARFSTHALGPERREEASSALAAVREALVGERARESDRGRPVSAPEGLA
jgi:hypothetical protein